jgi:DNA-directed RNA polymerase specialized sigma24 family protein
MEMAKELFITKLIDAETFWYVMEHGKFPPYEKLRLAEVKATEEMKQQEQAGVEGLLGNLPFNIGGQGQEQPPSDEELINNILQRRPDLQEQLNMLPPEEREEVIRKVIEGSV